MSMFAIGDRVITGTEGNGIYHNQPGFVVGLGPYLISVVLDNPGLHDRYLNGQPCAAFNANNLRHHVNIIDELPV